MKLVLHKEALMLHLVFAVVTGICLYLAGVYVCGGWKVSEWSTEGQHIVEMMWVILQVSPQIMYTEGGM